MVKKHWIPGHLNDVIDSLGAGVRVNSGENDTSGNFCILKNFNAVLLLVYFFLFYAIYLFCSIFIRNIKITIPIFALRGYS